MNVSVEKMPITVKIITKLTAEEMSVRKKNIFERIKNTISVPGFRKGTAPQEVVEQKANIEVLYKPLIDEIYLEVSSRHEIISSKDFLFFGDLRKNEDFVMEFVAELKPEVNLVDFEILKNDLKFEEVSILNEEIKEKIKFELNQHEKIEECPVEYELQNLDVAIIDFEGVLENETTAFPGGTAKGYKIIVNEIVSGKKQFIDNFEDQLVGMKKDEERNIKVTFPKNYHVDNLAGKKVDFKVKLNKIMKKVVPELNEDFVVQKGYKNIEEYKESLSKKLLEQKQKTNLEDFKKLVVTTIINKSEVSPIPSIMLDRESEKEWHNLLHKMGKTEQQMLKEHNLSKKTFLQNRESVSKETVKASLVLSKVIEKFNITADEDEVVQYTMNISKILNYTQEKKDFIKKDLFQDNYQYKLMKNATLNEKAVETLLNLFK